MQSVDLDEVSAEVLAYDVRLYICRTYKEALLTSRRPVRGFSFLLLRIETLQGFAFRSES